MSGERALAARRTASSTAGNGHHVRGDLDARHQLSRLDRLVVPASEELERIHRVELRARPLEWEMVSTPRCCATRSTRP